MDDGGREFVYSDGRFYSELGTFPGDGGPTPLVGVWEMRDARLGERMPRGLRVSMVAADADAPTVDGQTFEQRAIAAELEAADLRARTAEAERIAVDAEGRVNGMRVALAAARMTARRELAGHVQSLWELAQAVARVYEVRAELDATLADDELVPIDLHTFDATDLDDEDDRPPIAPAKLRRFVLDALTRTHPSVRLPTIGQAEVVEMAERVAGVLADPNATIRQAVDVGLQHLVQTMRDADTRAALEAEHDRHADAPFHVPGCPLCGWTREGWLAAPAGEPCPLCGHERGEHPDGADCEVGMHSGVPCGCKGPRYVP